MDCMPVLDPTNDDVAFVMMPGHGLYRFRVPQAPDLGWDRPTPRYAMAQERFICCEPRLYRSPVLRWEGFVGVAPQDEERLLVALRLAEIAILFVAFAASWAGPRSGEALAQLRDVVRWCIIPDSEAVAQFSEAYRPMAHGRA